MAADSDLLIPSRQVADVSVSKRGPRSLWWHPPRAKHLVPLAAALVVFYLSEPSALHFAAGLALVLAGLALRAWAAGHLVKSRWLTVTGPYAYLRHPFYAGALLVVAGLLMAAGPQTMWCLPPLVALFFLIYLPRKERNERARLLARHGDAARDYCAGVAAVWPRLRPWRPENDAGAEQPLWSPSRFRENSEMGTIQAVVLAVALLAVGFLVRA